MRDVDWTSWQTRNLRRRAARQERKLALCGLYRYKCHKWARRVGAIRQKEMVSRSQRGSWRQRSGGGARLYELIAICHLTSTGHRLRDFTQHNTTMDFRDSVSKPFKKLKHRFKEHRRKREEGSRNDSRGGGEYDTEGSETGQSSRLPLETEAMAESGPSKEKKGGDDKKYFQGDPPTSAPSISPSDNAKPNGTWAVSL